MPFNPEGAVYIAMAVALVVWLGIFTLLWRLDRQARDLRRRLDRPAQNETVAPRSSLEVRSVRADAAQQESSH